MRNDADAGGRRPPLVIGCGALAVELVELTRRAGLPQMDLACLPGSLHNRPEQIPSRVAARIRRARAEGYEQIFLAYADCGTGGLLDRMLETEPAAAGIARLEGAHCYEVYAGRAAFAQLHDEEPGTFYLTDYLARNFERLVVRGLGLDRHPELLPVYFGNYRRLVFLAQTEDDTLTVRARAAAARLGDLVFERRFVGLGELGPAVAAFAALGDEAAAGPAISNIDESTRNASMDSPSISTADETSRLISAADNDPSEGSQRALNPRPAGPFISPANRDPRRSPNRRRSPDRRAARTPASRRVAESVA